MIQTPLESGSKIASTQCFVFNKIPLEKLCNVTKFCFGNQYKRNDLVIFQKSRNIIVVDWGVGASKYGVKVESRESVT